MPVPDPVRNVPILDQAGAFFTLGRPFDRSLCPERHVWQKDDEASLHNL